VTTFVDTTALFALVDEGDEHHSRAAQWLRDPGRDPRELLVTHNLVVVETMALMERRLGADAVRVLLDAYLPGLSIVFVDEELHVRAVSGYRAALGAGVSFVDRVSFEVMRYREVERAFCFDRDFAREGFETVP
jgi:predicted nucleic acid-binding protein